MICFYHDVTVSKQSQGTFHLANILVLLTKAKALITLFFYPINILMMQNRQIRSLYYNATKLFLIYITYNKKRVNKKYEGYKMQEKALYAQIR